MNRIVPKADTPEGAVGEPVQGALDLAWPAAGPRGFFSFHYTVTELTMRDGRTQVSGRRVRLEDGKLSNETFEGELEQHAFVDAVREAQERVLTQWAALMNPFAWLLPAPRRARDDRD